MITQQLERELFFATSALVTKTGPAVTVGSGVGFGEAVGFDVALGLGVEVTAGSSDLVSEGSAAWDSAAESSIASVDSAEVLSSGAGLSSAAFGSGLEVCVSASVAVLSTAGVEQPASRRSIAIVPKIFIVKRTLSPGTFFLEIGSVEISCLASRAKLSHHGANKGV